MNPPPTQTLWLTNVIGKVRIRRQNGTRADVTGDAELMDSDFLTLLETQDGGRKGSSCTIFLAQKVCSSDVRVFKHEHSGSVDVQDSDIIILQQPCLELKSAVTPPRSNQQRHEAAKQAALVGFFPACVNLGQYFGNRQPPHYQVVTPGGTVMVDPGVTLVP